MTYVDLHSKFISSWATRMMNRRLDYWLSYFGRNIEYDANRIVYLACLNGLFPYKSCLAMWKIPLNIDHFRSSPYMMLSRRLVDHKSRNIYITVGDRPPKLCTPSLDDLHHFRGEAKNPCFEDVGHRMWSAALRGFIRVGNKIRENNGYIRPPKFHDPFWTR